MGSRRSRLVWTPIIGAAAGLLLATGIAHAEPTAADRETARSLMQEGRDLRDHGHAQDALKRFKAADDIMHVPTTALEVARTQAAVGLLIEARDTIANLRRTPAGANDPEPFRDARAKADELDTALEGRIPAITVVVQGAPEGPAPGIIIDGIPVPGAAALLPRRVNAGRHRVVARTASAQGEQTVDVHEGEQKEVQVSLTSSKDSPPEGTEPGPAPAQTDTTADTSGPTSHSPTLLTWVGAGVGGAGLIAGSITGLMSMSTVSKLKTECPIGGHCPPGPATSDYNSASTLAMISNVSFAVAGVGAAVAVVSLVVGHSQSTAPSQPAPEGAPAGDAPPAAQSRLHVVPWIGLGSAGVVGTF